jgi:hypothetical protein
MKRFSTRTDPSLDPKKQREDKRYGEKMKVSSSKRTDLITLWFEIFDSEMILRITEGEAVQEPC